MHAGEFGLLTSGRRLFGEGGKRHRRHNVCNSGTSYLRYYGLCFVVLLVSDKFILKWCKPESRVKNVA